MLYFGIIGGIWYNKFVRVMIPEIISTKSAKGKIRVTRSASKYDFTSFCVIICVLYPPIEPIFVLFGDSCWGKNSTVGVCRVIDLSSDYVTCIVAEENISGFV